ncbi:unnamed protein product [Arabidopsis lyrata]|nr:unnamed protein product [Arabidopsis lyrata]
MAAKKMFGAADASILVTGLSRSFDDGLEIVAALRDDLGKPELESSVYEVSLLRNSIKLALKQLKNWMAPEKAKTSLTTFPASAEIVSEPLGVVLVISAWNYPFLLSIDHVIGAISAGNAVVLKPSELAPASSALLAKLLEQYLDSSVVRVVEGAVTETTALLEQKWDKIFYTGSSKIGRVIMAAAAKRLTPVVLELGGKSPVVVDSDTDLKVTVRRIIAGKWGCNNGQACISPDYILTTKEYAPKVIDAMKKELETFYGKNPMESKDMSRIVNSTHFDRLSKLLDEKEVSDKIVYGVKKIFGPLLPILTLNNLEESFDMIRSRPKPLAAYLFTHNKKLKERFATTVSAGGIVVNDIAVHLALHTLPFGGVGESGMGAYHGKFSFDAFSHKKAVLYRSLFGDSAVRYPPYSRGKLRLLKALVDSNIFDIFKALLGLS